mgnify:FL=1
MSIRDSLPSRAVDFGLGVFIGLAVAGAVLLAAWDAARETRAKLDACLTEACDVCRGGR